MSSNDGLKSIAIYTSSVRLQFEQLSEEEGLFAAFDLKNDFSHEWYNANHPPAGANEQALAIDKLNLKLPIFTKARAPNRLHATDIYLFVT